MAFSAFFNFAVLVLLKTAGTERDRVIKLNARADLRRLTDDYPSTVIDEKVFTDFCAWVNVDSGTAVRPFGHDARYQRHLLVKEMRHSMNGNRFQRGISENDFLIASRRRIAFVGGVDVRPKQSAHRRQLLQKLAQDLFGFCFGCLVRWDFAEASADFFFQSCAQMSNANPSGIGQIIRAHQGFAAKTGEHQAHQLGAGRFYSETRGESGGGVQIIDAAGFAIGLKQFLNCVAVRRVHCRNMRRSSVNERESVSSPCSARVSRVGFGVAPKQAFL